MEAERMKKDYKLVQNLAAWKSRLRWKPRLRPGCSTRRSRWMRARSRSENGDGRFHVGRHCERSEAIHGSEKVSAGLLRRFAPRNDASTFPAPPLQGIRHTLCRRYPVRRRFSVSSLTSL